MWRTIPLLRSSASALSPPRCPPAGAASGSAAGRSHRRRGARGSACASRWIESRLRSADHLAPGRSTQRALGEHVGPLRPDRRSRARQPPPTGRSRSRRRCDPVDAELDRVSDRRDRLLVVLRPPAELPAAAADRPGAEAHTRDLEARGAGSAVASWVCVICVSFASSGSRCRDRRLGGPSPAPTAAPTSILTLPARLHRHADRPTRRRNAKRADWTQTFAAAAKPAGVCRARLYPRSGWQSPPRPSWRAASSASATAAAS